MARPSSFLPVRLMSQHDRTSLDLPVPEERREWPDDRLWQLGQQRVLVLLLVRSQAEVREAGWRVCYLYPPALVQFPQ